MSTKLTPGKSVKREVNGGYYGSLIVEVTFEGLYLRQKGRKTKYGPLSWAGEFVRAGDLHAQQHRKARKPRARRGLKVGL